VRERKEGDRIHLAAGDHALSSLLPAYRGRAPHRIPGAGRPSRAADERRNDGDAEGVLGTHGAYVAGRAAGEAEPVRPGDGDSPIMLPLPLFHVCGNVGVQSLALITRNAMSLVPNPATFPTSSPRSTV
jgi:hypothetical protein